LANQGARSRINRLAASELSIRSISCSSAAIDAPDEAARIAAGASIYMRVLGTVHPRVLLEVGAAPQV
jgi:hypothetical protein